MAAAPIGLIANPASGKDIRRLVAHASTFDNAEKVNTVRRVLVGAMAQGATRFLYMRDEHDLVGAALDALRERPDCKPLAVPCTGTAIDTERAARALCEAGCGVVVSLGGDGTNRMIVRGWREAPLIAISTGTNNVFPLMLEGTVAGAAAGLVAASAVALAEVAAQAKRIALTVEDEGDDLALIDAALVAGAFAGTRAIWDVGGLRRLVLARAEPAAVGLSAIGGLLAPVGAADEGGLELELCGEGADDAALCTLAPIAPGRYEPIALRRLRRLAPGEPVELCGPGLLALDGERERRLKPGQRASTRVLRDGPHVVDVARTLRLAAERGRFRLHEAQRDGLVSAASGA
jgi:predicted polyphosphate/ATP-dependent NAD kinase